MKTGLGAFGMGALFGVGLAVAGMTQPAKIVGFLDFFGDWDPSLAMVMVGAIGVYLPVYRVIVRRGAPLFASGFSLPTRQDIDARLISGAGLFGIGWGLAGYCPGPALTALGAGSAPALAFALGMLLGMIAFTFVDAGLPRGAPSRFRSKSS